MKKILVCVGIALVVILILAGLGIRLFLDSAIKKGVETIGPKIAKVDIKLDAVSLSLLTGSGKVKGLVVGNPEGYKTPHAISVGTASVAVSSGSLLSDKIVVRSIRVEAPDITFEGGLGGNNLSKILDNVKAATGSGKSGSQETKDAKPGKKLQVDDFLITGAKVHASLTGMGGKETTVTLPDIHLANLGTGPEGISSADLTQKVLDEVLNACVKASGSALSNIGKGATDAAKESVDKATKSISDLFKKKK